MTEPFNGEIRFIDLHPPSETLEEDVVRGLRKRPKSLPPKLLYDKRGCELFDQICQLEEYYPTRTELEIMRDHADPMAERLGPRCAIIDYGSGSGLKATLLLQNLAEPVAYVSIDISEEQLLAAAEELHEQFPDLEIIAVRADFTQQLGHMKFRSDPARRVIYFAGSTIGNFTPTEATAFLQRALKVCGPDGALLIGVDLKKDKSTLQNAYDDRAGVTAAFNLNLLRRFNRELDADFALNQFRHQAIYNENKGRVEMHLQSLQRQTVRVAGTPIDFDEGETIHTESSYKYSTQDFKELARSSGLEVKDVWVDRNRLFSVQYLTAQENGSRKEKPLS